MRVHVASRGELPPGQCKVVEAHGHCVAVFNLRGEFFALDNTCPHMGGALGEGTVMEDVVSCPWHGWRFCLKTGENPSSPVVKVRTYPVQVEGDAVFLDL